MCECNNTIALESNEFIYNSMAVFKSENNNNVSDLNNNDEIVTHNTDEDNILDISLSQRDCPKPLSDFLKLSQPLSAREKNLLKELLVQFLQISLNRMK